MLGTFLIPKKDRLTFEQKVKELNGTIERRSQLSDGTAILDVVIDKDNLFELAVLSKELTEKYDKKINLKVYLIAGIVIIGFTLFLLGILNILL